MSKAGLDRKDQDAITKDKVDELYAIRERTKYYTDELNRLQWKKYIELSQDDQKIVDNAKEYIKALNESNDLFERFKGLYILQARELDAFLKGIYQEQDIVNFDTKVDNLALATETGWNISESQKAFATKYRAIFSLCNLNWDDKMDKLSDNWLISGYEVFEFIRKNAGQIERIIFNICDILWIKDKTDEWLANALANDWELKNKFFSKLYIIAGVWGNLADALIKGPDWIAKSIATLNTNSELLWDKLMKGLVPKLDKDYDKLIEELTTKSANLEWEEKNRVEALISMYKNSKSKFIDAFRLNWAWLALSLVDWSKWAWVWISASNSVIDNFIKKVTGDWVTGMQFILWGSYIWWAWVPWLWINFSSRDFQVSENVKAKLNWGLFLNVPYLAWTLEYNYNSEELDKLGFKDFSGTSNSFWVAWNISTLWFWVTLFWNKDKLKAFEEKEKSFSKLLDNILAFNWNFDRKVVENNLKAQTSLSEEDKANIPKYVDKLEEVFELIWYNKLGEKQQKVAIERVKYVLLNEWKNTIYLKAEKEGLEITWIWFWLQFVAGFFPLPTFWIRVSDYSVWYVDDTSLGATQILGWSWRTTDTQITTLSSNAEEIAWKEIIDPISALKDKKVDDYLKENISKFDWSNWYSPIAMRNPRDYPWLFKSLQAWKIEDSYSNLLRLLKTDPLLKNDKQTVDLIKSFGNDLTINKKAYVVSQFMDAIFKDKNTLKDIFDRFWKAREEWLKWVYKDPKVYQKIIKYRNQVKQLVISNWDIAKYDWSTVFWFVASYKIGWENEKIRSLWKWEVPIPPGLASIIWWEKWKININEDEFLVNHIINNLKNTPFYNNLKNSLESIISVKYSGFKFHDFETFLRTWEFNNWNGTIKLKRNFFFFLYWICANEALWLEIEWIDLWDGKTVITQLWTDWTIVPKSPVLNVKDYGIWVVWGKERPKEKIEPTPTPTPTPEPEPATITTTAWTNDVTVWIVTPPAVIETRPLVSVSPVNVTPTTLTPNTSAPWWDFN